MSENGKLSLLYRPGHAETEKAPNPGIIADLMLERTFAELCPDINRRRYFLDILASPLTEKEDIIYRRDILRDFMANRNLIGGLKKAFGTFATLKEEQQGERTKVYSILRSNDPDAAFKNANSVIQISSVTLTRTLYFLREISDLLNIYKPRSEGLSTLAARMERLSRGPAFGGLMDIAENFSVTNDSDVYDARINIGENGRIYYSTLKGVERAEQQKSAPASGGGMFKFITHYSKDSKDDKEEKSAPREKQGVRAEDVYGVVRNEALGTAVTEISGLFLNITKSVFDEFGSVTKELCFYETALCYCDAMKAKGVPLSFPQLGDKTEIEALYDPLLCVLNTTASYVTPNEFKIPPEAKGILIRGENNSGKTVFLRSAGCAQLLAQAGLPVTAKAAVIAPKKAVYTLFAAAEKEFTAGNDAGRFEQEVRDIASMLETMEPDSLVLLNETFQTTSYDEGAQGLYHILNYISLRGAKWLLVTHLHRLFSLFEGGETTKLRTGEGYKLIPYGNGQDGDKT